MDYGGAAAAGSGGGSVLKIVGDLAKGSKMPTVSVKLVGVEKPAHYVFVENRMLRSDPRGKKYPNSIVTIICCLFLSGSS